MSEDSRPIGEFFSGKELDKQTKATKVNDEIIQNSAETEANAEDKEDKKQESPQ